MESREIRKELRRIETKLYLSILENIERLEGKGGRVDLEARGQQVWDRTKWRLVVGVDEEFIYYEDREEYDIDEADRGLLLDVLVKLENC
jgi:hypothetical protein